MPNFFPKYLNQFAFAPAMYESIYFPEALKMKYGVMFFNFCRSDRWKLYLSICFESNWTFFHVLKEYFYILSMICLFMLLPSFFYQVFGSLPLNVLVFYKLSISASCLWCISRKVFHAPKLRRNLWMTYTLSLSVFKIPCVLQ